MPALNTHQRVWALVRVAVPLLGLPTVPALWMATQRLVVARRNAVCVVGLLFLNTFMMIPEVFLSPSSNVVLKVSIPFTLLTAIYQAFDTDRRIRRTLHPGSSQRTRSEGVRLWK